MNETMKIILTMLIGAFFCMTTQVNAEGLGVIGKTHEDGVPVIYKFVNELPKQEVQNQLQWLTVISWKYSGNGNNGMPPTEENQKMIALEDAIVDNLENDKILRHVYSRTGNNLKEFVYYIHEQGQFLELFNKTLSGRPKYPIEISFYEDIEWEDFKRVLSDFKKAANN